MAERRHAKRMNDNLWRKICTDLDAGVLQVDIAKELREEGYAISQPRIAFVYKGWRLARKDS